MGCDGGAAGNGMGGWRRVVGTRNWWGEIWGHGLNFWGFVEKRSSIWLSTVLGFLERPQAGGVSLVGLVFVLFSMQTPLLLLRGHRITKRNKAPKINKIRLSQGLTGPQIAPEPKTPRFGLFLLLGGSTWWCLRWSRRASRQYFAVHQPEEEAQRALGGGSEGHFCPPWVGFGVLGFLGRGCGELGPFPAGAGSFQSLWEPLGIKIRKKARGKKKSSRKKALGASGLHSPVCWRLGVLLDVPRAPSWGFWVQQTSPAPFWDVLRQ